MTVCVAGIAGGLNEIALVADRRITVDVIAADVDALKIRPFARRWVAMFAGNDIGNVRAILEHVQQEFATNADPTRVQVAAVFRQAFKIHRRTLIEERILASLGIDLKEFWQNGHDRLGPVAFDELRREARAVKVDVEFLVAGYNDDDQPHIFTISDQGLSYRTEVGFWAIGSGAYAAITSLAYRRMNPAKPSAEGEYIVCESKFMAEGPFVGPDTVALVLGVDGSLRHFSIIELESIRNIWAREGQAPFPKDLDKQMPKGTNTRNS